MRLASLPPLLRADDALTGVLGDPAGIVAVPESARAVESRQVARIVIGVRPEHLHIGAAGVIEATVTVDPLPDGAVAHRWVLDEAMMMTPTIIPTPIIMIGSMIEVRFWMAASTSSS